jgi:hypothetical protein
LKLNKLILFIFFINITVIGHTKIRPENSVTNVGYTTHLYSYEISETDYTDFFNMSSGILVSMGSISSDQFDEYRHIKIKSEITDKINFRFRNLKINNPEIYKDYNNLEFSYKFNKLFELGVFSELDSEKENIDIGFSLYNSFDKLKNIFKINFIDFQYNKKTKDNKRYSDYPVEYTYNSLYKNNNIIFYNELYYIPEYTFNYSSDTITEITEFNYYNFVMFNNTKFLSENIYLKLRLNLLKKISANQSYDNESYITGFEFDRFKFYNKLSFGFNYAFLKQNIPLSLINRKFTPYFKHLIYNTKKSDVEHFLYTTFLNNNNLQENYFVKYKIQYKYLINKNSRINFILSIEKEDNKTLAFGGAAAQFISEF